MPTTKEQREKWQFCGAKKRNGETCRNYAGLGTEHKGIGRCKFHLGNSANHKKAAIKVVAERQQRHFESQMLEFGQMVKLDPLEALLTSMYLSASHEAYLRQEIAQVPDGEEHRFRREVLLRQWSDERDRLAKTGKMALDAGVDERQVRLAERYGEAIARLIQGILGDLALNKRQQAEVPAVVRRWLVNVSSPDADQLALPAATA